MPAEPLLPLPPSPPCFLSGAGGEQTAADVHATLCALVTTEAAQHSTWAEYAAVLLDEETASFFAARLTEGKGVSDGDESNPPSKKQKKKRKLQADSEEADGASASDVDPGITLRVACLDGSSLDLEVPPGELVREVKRAIGQVRRRLVTVSPYADAATKILPFTHAIPARRRCGVCQRPAHPPVPDMLMSAQVRDMDPGLIELFVDGKEDGLPDAGRLDDLGLGSGSVVFMLFRLGWRWEESGSNIALSGEGLVATVTAEMADYQLVTGGSPMTEGRHYWEVELTGPCFMFGAVRPGLDHDKEHFFTNDAYSISGYSGGLCGNGNNCTDQQGKFAQGDRIGVLLDLDAGWMRIYRNGKRCGPGFTEGVTGPLVRAAHLRLNCDKVTVLPGAVAPTDGAGAADDEQ
jgi:hypothetical protein